MSTRLKLLLVSAVIATLANTWVIKIQHKQIHDHLHAILEQEHMRITGECEELRAEVQALTEGGEK